MKYRVLKPINYLGLGRLYSIDKSGNVYSKITDAMDEARTAVLADDRSGNE